MLKKMIREMLNEYKKEEEVRIWIGILQRLKNSELNNLLSTIREWDNKKDLLPLALYDKEWKFVLVKSEEEEVFNNENVTTYIAFPKVAKILLREFFCRPIKIS